MSDVLFSYGGLFVWSFLSATVVPLSSEAALALLVGTSRRVALPVLVATAGNYLGACTTYWLGRRASRALGDRGIASAGAARAARLLARHGRPALLLSWLPVVGDALVACAGAARMPFLGFSVWVALGKGLRYLAVAWAAAGLSA
jgi:membrane protein YqaA with SNARE-associated domain